MKLDKTFENDLEIDSDLLKLANSIDNDLDWENKELVDIKVDSKESDDDDIDDLLLNSLEKIDDIEEKEEEINTPKSTDKLLTKKDERKKKRLERRALRKDRKETRKQLRLDRRARRKLLRQERKLNRQQRGGFLRMFKEKLISLALKSLTNFRNKITETNLLTLSLDKLITFLNNLTKSKFANDLEKGVLNELSSEIDKKINNISETIGNKLYEVYKVVMELIPGFKILKVISVIITPFINKSLKPQVA